MHVVEIIRERLDYKTIKSWNLEDWSTWLDKQIESGQIAKADWNDARSAISKQLSRASESAQKIYLALDNDERNALDDLYWAAPSDFQSLNKAEKIAQKSPDSAYKSAVLDVVASYRPLKAKLEQLKPLVVTAAQQREVVNTQKAEKKKAEESSAEALVKALADNRSSYVETAKEQALKYITRIKAKIADAGGVDNIAPNPVRDPKSPIKSDEYNNAVKKRNWWTMMDKMDVDRYVNYEAQAAKASYDAWTYKLVQKIGKPVDKADVKGDPWTGSVIRVETNDGEQQAWRTQQIINTSKLGKQFYQFPTRRLK